MIDIKDEFYGTFLLPRTLERYANTDQGLFLCPYSVLLILVSLISWIKTSPIFGLYTVNYLYYEFVVVNKYITTIYNIRQ